MYIVKWKRRYTHGINWGAKAKNQDLRVLENPLSVHTTKIFKYIFCGKCPGVMNSHSKKILTMYISDYFGRNKEWRWDYINRNIASLVRDGANCRKAATDGSHQMKKYSYSARKISLKKNDGHPWRQFRPQTHSPWGQGYSLPGFTGQAATIQCLVVEDVPWNSGVGLWLGVIDMIVQSQ